MFTGVLATPLLFPCWTFFMLHFFSIEKYWKWTKDKTQPKKRHYTDHREIASLLFWYPITHFCHYIVLNGWKVKRNQFTLFLEKNIFAKARMWIEIISPRHKILSISCRHFNDDSENEWTQKKNILVLKKIFVLALLFSKLLSHNYRPQ